jgi:hypothetical protein
VNVKTGKTMAPTILVEVHDIEFEPGPEIEKAEVGFYLHRNMKFVDSAAFEDPHVMRCPMRNAKAQECVRVIVQNTQDDDFYGSISLNVANYLIGSSTKQNTPYRQWLTLFDSVEDDEFDGVLGEDDEEYPKVLVTVTVIQEEVGFNSVNRSNLSKEAGSSWDMSPGSRYLTLLFFRQTVTVADYAGGRLARS